MSHGASQEVGFGGRWSAAPGVPADGRRSSITMMALSALASESPG